MIQTLRGACLSVVLCGALLAQAGTSAADAKLIVVGDIPQPLTLTKEDLAKLPRTSMTVDSQGTETTYAGVLLYEILKRAGAPVDRQLAGKALASYLLAEARDGYQVVYVLAEFDPSFTDNRILVADTIDGKPLSGNQGPFRLVAPYEKKGARSIRMLEKITLIRLRK